MKEIKLTQGKVALVDDNDYRWLKKMKWYAVGKNETYYAVRDNKRIWMHRIILGLTDTQKFVDHIDHNGLNNQRSNLRIATKAQNIHNGRSHKGSSSKFKGVTWDKSKQRWKSRLGIGGVVKHLGHFVVESEAAIAYNNAAKELHGEFFSPNVII